MTKNWKLLLIPIWAVLVIAGTVGDGSNHIPNANAQGTFNIVCPSGSSCATTSSVATFQTVEVSWQQEYSYNFNPTASEYKIYVKDITFTGVTDSGERVPLVVANNQLAKIKVTGTDEAVQGFYYGIAPSNNYYSKDAGDCGNNDCNFIDGISSQKLNGSSTSANPINEVLTIPANKFSLKTGLQKYKIVPVLDILNGDDRAIDTSSFFTITWDSKAPIADTLTKLQATPPVQGTHTKLATPITGRGSISTQGSGSPTGLLASLVNIILSVVFAIVHSGLTLIYGLIIGPITRAMLGATPEFAAAKIPSFVEYGWVYVRDVMNLMFILVLIFAGVATMLRIGEYGLKKTITRVIIVALAVNFSLLAGQIVLNFAQIMMNTFIDPTVADQIWKGVDISRINVFDLQAGDATQGTAMLLFNIVYEIGMVATLGALAAFLLIRLAGVWLLLILAPAAYILYLFEPTQEYLGKWWHKFLSYAFFAPVMAFFLAIIAKLINSQYFGQAHIEGAESLSNGIISLLQGVMVIVMLVSTLKLASSMGIAGADTVIHGAEKAWKWGATSGVRFSTRAVGAGIRGIGGRFQKSELAPVRGLGKGLSLAGAGLRKAVMVPEIAAGVAKRMAHEVEHRYGKEVSLGEASIVTALSHGPGPFGAAAQYLGAEPNAKDIELLKQAAEDRKNILSKNSTEITAVFETALHHGEGTKAVAALKALAQNTDLNEIMNEYGKKHGHKYTSDQRGLQKFIEDTLVPVLGKDAAYRLGYDISRDAEDVGHWNYARAFKAVVDPKTHQVRYENNDEAEKEAVANIAKMDPQARVRLNRLGAGTIESSLGNEGWSDQGERMWQMLAANNDTRQRMTASQRFNAMFRNSDKGFHEKKDVWLQQADILSTMTDDEWANAKSVIYDPTIVMRDENNEVTRHVDFGTGQEAWAAFEQSDELDKDGKTKAKHQVFNMQNVHRYFEAGKITEDELKANPNLLKRYNEWRTDPKQGLKAIGTETKKP